MARILVVDDSKEILDLARLFLTDCGHDVLTANSAMDAMEILNSYRFDLGIFDIEMPYTNGFQLSQTLRNSLRYKFFPIIFLTRRQEKKDVERAIKMSAEGYILKPLKKEKLIEAVDFVLKKIPPAQYPDVEVTQTSLSRNGHIVSKTPFEIQSISDIGINILSSKDFPLDEIVEINPSLFTEIGIDPVPLKVLNTRQVAEASWEIKLAFLALTYPTLQKLRSWVLSHGVKKHSS